MLVRLMWLAPSACWPALNHGSHANSRTRVDHVDDLATPTDAVLSQLATGLSVLAPAQRAGAKRLRSLVESECGAVALGSNISVFRLFRLAVP